MQHETVPDDRQVAAALSGLTPEAVASLVAASCGESAGHVGDDERALPAIDWAKALQIAILILQQIAPLLSREA